MNKINWKKASINVHKLLYVFYKKEIKNDKFLKQRMKELKTHFKKYGWEIDYTTSLNETQLQNNPMKFNVLLDLIGLKPYYKNNRFNIMITKKKIKRRIK